MKHKHQETLTKVKYHQTTVKGFFLPTNYTTAGQASLCHTCPSLVLVLAHDATSAYSSLIPRCEGGGKKALAPFAHVNSINHHTNYLSFVL